MFCRFRLGVIVAFAGLVDLWFVTLVGLLEMAFWWLLVCCVGWLLRGVWL